MAMKVIIQGDDLAYNSQADEGIFYAYEYGALTSTTVMANLLKEEHKYKYRQRLKDMKNKSGLNKPPLGVGVHLNVTFGKPLSNTWPQKEFNRPLRGSGKPEEWKGSTWIEYFKQFTQEQVEAEYRKQIELAMDFFPNIDHLDSHHYTASYEPLKEVYEKLAIEYDLAVRADAPLSEKPVYGGNFNYERDASRKLNEKGIKTADNYILTLFFNEDDPVASFIQALQSISEASTEIMFHPAKGANADDWRIKDLDVLTHPKVVDFLKDENIELINYSML
jgi:predicted glycoside hydrolase/deacetylase ChbG (UPF0249 family)